MKFTLATIITALSSTTAIAAPTCYQLSQDGEAWSRTPEVLCVDEGSDVARITLETGLFQRETVATFNMQLLQRARCFDCNQDVFGVANPSNSIFNALKISFDGKDVRGEEQGTVAIGSNQFYYRSF